ncbi:hypothetical protein CV093_07450 [Oceanobacillus sp. 143]|uniref:Uncharacterized protein n=1 Tax=Oceanobacillus zhaokaii TaxID=2052660 RepID=A0A345PFA5_9BACI|nr:hypothetical protein [Oceanobacillus zhaokaii]AXI08685.1 hypothetical protein CUC15_07060 [Oceanobacillus zhaokaii]QGS68443.1 hypothetical protein CV093_07450 [Oceanobacillus sp. 143]
MHLEWFDRVCGELQDSLNSICEKYDENGRMLIERGAKHPRIDFFTDNEKDDRDYFCSLFFDPHNEEFYIQTVDPEYGHISKVLLEDIEDIIDAVHQCFHEYMEDEDAISEVEIIDDGTDFEGLDEVEDELLLEEIDVEWETPEVTAYYKENEVEVSYQFGITEDTGEGVIKRINRSWTNDEELVKDETIIKFSKEEASTLIAMIASHMDSISGIDEYMQ